MDTTSELAFGLENRGLPVSDIKDQVDKTIEEFGIQRLKDRSIFKLSGGEKQKIACGCVSACTPDVFVLDEPSANLDNESMHQLAALIQKWKKMGKTIVIAEHRLAYIWELIDRAVILKNGSILYDLTGQDLKRIQAEELHKLGLRSNTKIGTSFKESGNAANMIQFQNFSFGYEKDKQIVKFENLCIPENEITAIVGQNGRGKTTLLRCICGLERKCKGTMMWQNTGYNRKRRLKEVFLVMQDVNHQLFTESVLDEVLISMKEEDEEKAFQILSDLDLLNYKERHPMSLSGGQKQRVAVATAIASERKILLFDEPTSGLDYRHMLQVARMLAKLKDTGKTVIVVTHDLEFIHALDANTIALY